MVRLPRWQECDDEPMSSNTSAMTLSLTSKRTVHDSVAHRARRGDVAAFDQLMQRHERLVYGTAWRLLGRVEDAQDAAQEVFLRLYRFLDRLDPQRPLEPWLYRVTVNVCRDQQRRRRPGVPLEEAEAAQPLAAPLPSPATHAEARQEHRIVEAGLRSLSEKERAALVLRDIEGLSTAEVASTLGTTATTVRSHICRARLKLARFRQRWEKEAAS